MDSLLESLNPVQREAVQHNKGPLLLLSGAGSGKTRVITERIAYLIGNHKVSPFSILAVTFTKKAAEEMKSRLEELIGQESKSLQVATFHSTCARILRRNINRLGYNPSFTIYDAEEQKILIKEIVKTLQLQWETPGPILTEISKAKREFLNPEEYADRIKKKYPDDKGGFFEKSVARIYRIYQNRLRRDNALDFDDLIKLTVELFEKNPNVLEYYQDKFQYILVDEYQDTNRGQYFLIRALSQKHRNLCVVGDDDQSIYAFRGADISNIQDFKKDYPNAKVLRLVQNYRSTQNIINAANHVILNNQKRMEKKSWTENEEGSLINCYGAMSSSDEGAYVLRQIKGWQERGRKYSDCAVLYRTNAQSRIFEEALQDAEIPYRIVGGAQFWKRIEVKDIIAYMRVIMNPGGKDTANLLKHIINVPNRGIGIATVQEIEDFAQKEGIPLFRAMQRVDEVSALRYEARNKVRAFTEFIASFNPGNPPANTVKALLDRSGYLRVLSRKGTIEAQSQEENLSELVAAVTEYEESGAEPTLAGFLKKVASASSTDDIEDDEDVVTLITLHGTKGLEFPIVFMVGVEEGLLPHNRSRDTKDGLEEERRLCYVGITRAQEHLYLTSACSRGAYDATPSRFIKEIPPELLNTEESSQPSQQPAFPSPNPNDTDKAPRLMERIDERPKRVNEPLPNIDNLLNGDIPPTTPAKATKDATLLETSDNPIDRTEDRPTKFDKPETLEAEREELIKKFNPKIGDIVRHRTFGEGVVTMYSVRGSDTRVTIKFTESNRSVTQGASVWATRLSTTPAKATKAAALPETFNNPIDRIDNLLEGRDKPGAVEEESEELIEDFDYCRCPLCTSQNTQVEGPVEQWLREDPLYTSQDTHQDTQDEELIEDFNVDVSDWSTVRHGKQYRIVKVDIPIHGSYYAVQYAHRTFFLNRLVWKDLFDNRNRRAGDAMFFSFIAAKEALEKHIDEENYGRNGEGDSNPNVTPEHEDFSDGGDIDF